MPDLTVILIAILVIAILWMLIKFVFKLTLRIFTCGVLLIVALGGLVFLARALDWLPAF